MGKMNHFLFCLPVFPFQTIFFVKFEKTKFYHIQSKTRQQSFPHYLHPFVVFSFFRLFQEMNSENRLNVMAFRTSRSSPVEPLTANRKNFWQTNKKKNNNKKKTEKKLEKWFKEREKPSVTNCVNIPPFLAPS